MALWWSLKKGLNSLFLLKSFCIMVIDSSPPPITTSALPIRTMSAAVATAKSPEEQKRLTVPPGTVTGSPAMTATLRPTLKPCGPSGKPVPITTSSISAASSFGTFFIASRMQCAAMSSGRVRLNEPRNDFARPVRAVATITASRSAMLPPVGPARRRAQLDARHLARCEESNPLSGEAEAAVHVQGRAPVVEHPAIEAADELRQVARLAPRPRGQGELPPVRVPRQHERHT